ncbi:MAG: diacylglycerol kinase family lipid kinase [Polyangiaceae bacterium]|nr:diacylglycerol kinase family lipid kinase [Polyangiaceae bacterium]
MKPLIIVNPSAAGGRAGRTFPAIRGVLERRLGEVDAVLTERGLHATELAAAAAGEGRRLVVAVGGDGTFHEVVNGVVAVGGDTRVGIVPIGTGGDFRRTLGLEHRLDVYVDALARGRERRVDVGRASWTAPGGHVESRVFVNILSVGMGGLVDRYVAKTTKAFGGKAAYMWASARALMGIRRGRLRCRVTLAGETREEQVHAYVIAVCNGRYFGGGMEMAPMARVDDARFEVVAMNAPSKLAFVAFSQRIYGGRHLSVPGVVHFACDRIAIDLDNDDARDVFLLDVDGEPAGRLPVTIELLPGALRLAA